MAAIVRVKRHFQDDPLEAVILNTKRRKLDEKDENQNSSQIFTFTGTVKKEESPFKHITSSHQNKFEQVKQHHTNILEKIRNQTKDASKNSRLKIIDCFRALDDRENTENDEKNYTLIEVESSPTEGKEADKEENHEDYVYDIYYAKNPDIDDFCFDNLESIEPLEELVGHLPPDPEEVFETESDENDENNWRNDYPDSDIDEDDILNGIVACRLHEDVADEEPELSTSDEDVYGDYNDTALQYGKRYAKFKKREIEKSDGDDNDDEDEENDYSDDDGCGIDRDFICDVDRCSEPDD